MANPKDGTITIKIKGDAYRVCVWATDNKGKTDAVPLYLYQDKAQAQAKARELMKDGKI